MRFTLIDSYSQTSDRLRSQIKFQIYLPPENDNFQIHTDRFLLLRSQTGQVTDQVADPPPPEDGNFRFILMDSYARELRQTRWQIKWHIYPPENGNLRFTLIDSQPENSGRSSGRSIILQENGIFQIHTDRFLL